MTKRRATKGNTPLPSNKTLLATLVAAVLSSPSGVMGANEDNRQDDETSDSTQRLEEVKVLGRRIFRPSDQTSATGLRMDLVDTPQSISIITPEILETIGANNVYEALSLVPGVNKSGCGFGRCHIILRANNTLNRRINGTRIVGLTQDLEQNAFERIEILRGPGTVLYGATGGFGGEINQILKRASPDFHAEGKFEGGEHNYQRYEFDVNGAAPYSDEALNARVIGTYENWGLPVEVVDISNNKWMLMATLSYELAPDTEANLWVLREEWDYDATDGAFLNFLPNDTLALPPVGWDEYYFSDARRSVGDSSQTFLIASLEQQLDNDWTWKMQTTWASFARDQSYYYPFGPAGAYGLSDNDVYFYTYDADSTRSELTFLGSLGGDFELFGRDHSFFGVFEFEDDLVPERGAVRRSIGLGFLNQFEGGQEVLSDGSPIPVIDRSTLPLASLSLETNREYRGSFQVLLNPFDRLHVLGGFLVHQSELEQSNEIRNTESSLTFTEVIKRFGVTYDLVRNWDFVSEANLYYSYSEGFQPNVGVMDRNGNFLTDPQLLEQHEVGIKAELFDGRVGASLAFYDSKLTNIPASDAFLLGDVIAGAQTLVGERPVKGVELELVGEWIPGWNMSFNYAYTDPELRDPNFNFRGPVRSVPDHTGALFTSYEFLGGALRGLRLSGGVEMKADYHYNDALRRVEQYGTLKTGSHTHVRLGVSYSGFTGALDGLEIFGRVDNLLDEDILYAKESHPGFAITRELPRTFRAGIKYTYD